MTKRAHRGEPMQSPIHDGEVLDDGSLVITEEQLARFGGGDPKVGRRELRALLSADMERSGPTYTAPVRECPKSIRVPGPHDEDALVDLWMLDLQDNAEHVAEIDEEKVRENIRAGTRGRGALIACIDDDAGEPVAMALLMPMQWHWSNAWFFQEMCTFVHPDHRKSRHADDLLQWQKWAITGMTRGMGHRCYLLNGVLGAWRIHAKTAMYRRRFCQAGSVFIYPAPAMKGS